MWTTARLSAAPVPSHPPRCLCQDRCVDRTLRRLHPEPAADVHIADAYGDPDRSPPPGRPWVMITMVASVDGATTMNGASGPLGNASDTAVLSATRAAADLVVVGAGTVRAERYGPPKTPGQRVGVVTSGGSLDMSGPLFSSGAGFLIMPESGPHLDVPTLRVGDASVDAAAMLSRVHELVGRPVGVVQVEGGPTLNGWLVDAGCVDEFNLTLAPRIAGGAGPRAVVGAGTSADLDLAHLLVDDGGFVFSRWTTRR